MSLRWYLAAAFFAACLSATPSLSPRLAAAPAPDDPEIHHGGGCRKDSPPGRCCHAGSKPYHCH